MARFTPSMIRFNVSYLLLPLLVIIWFQGQHNNVAAISTLDSIITASSHCKTSATNNQDVFVAFITDQRMASPLLQNLCKSPVINRQFGEVEVRWSHNEEEIIQYVGKGLADLALVKENVMQAFATEATHGYRVIAHYQDYATYLISMKEKPLIEKQYLWGKRLGLLDYPSSRSGHIIPKGMLHDLGMSEDSLDIVYANSHEALRDLLAAGEVDIISSFWQASDQQRFSRNYITPIKTGVSGSKWYLRMERQNTDLACDVQQTLLSLSSAFTSTYYHNLIMMDTGCKGVERNSGEVSTQ
ncbi:PhnD/SsuA/transferrin family substrate-binding protein [Aestuariibacter halophilus]|uniref:PhnD/SsuA/transferrin family substrate-binding protein n=1 Tax=Fluctibacter halophilus TaxID=226011 RepID=A0ABS8G8A2_9ALTE|nr:PhnD/SsuA/transferrin family substrate-binding protein [Aestuariibacter halophilus]MCC2616391.1 PhnD/SsuA/transferrin family substrate-binding protein [Aestuariibacter halophilus]